MDNFKINPLKLIVRIKSWIGWFLAIVFPFSAWGIVKLTNAPIIIPLIYWIGMGIILRYTFDIKLPYFNIQIGKIKKETLIFVIITAIGGYYYSRGVKIEPNSAYLIFNPLLYGIVNGLLEVLVWVNIVDLAGAKIKLNGYVAIFIYVGMIDFLFWNNKSPNFQGNLVAFIVIEAIMLITGLAIYKKTEDITLWSIQHMVYNIIVVMLTGSGTNLFLHI